MITTTYQFFFDRISFDALLGNLTQQYGEGESQTQLDATVVSHPDYTLSYARDAQDGVLAVLMVNPAWVMPNRFKPALRGPE